MRKYFSGKCVGFLGFLLFLCAVEFSSLPAVFTYADDTTTTQAAEVQDEIPAIKLNLKNVSIVKGRTYALKVYNLPEDYTVTFKSADTDIATVDEEGVITAVEYGETVVTVYIKSNDKTVEKLSCDVTVGPAAISVKLTKSRITLVVGKKTTLRTIVQPINTVEKEKFVSLDSSIATVSTGGCITAKSEGVTKIYTMLDNSKFDVCTVTVLSEEAYEALLNELSGNTESSSDESDKTDTTE